MALVRDADDADAGEDAEPRDRSLAAGGGAGRRFGGFLQNGCALTPRSSTGTPWYLLKWAEKLYSHKHLHTDVTAAFFITAGTQERQDALQ